MKRNYTSMRTTAFLLMTLVATDASAQQEPMTGYAPINGINMYYEVHGGGEPVVLLHGAFMTITNNWAGWILGTAEDNEFGRNTLALMHGRRRSPGTAD